MSNEVQKHVLAEQDYISGMKYIDIADKYGVALDTVKSWKKRHGWVRKKGAHKTKKGCTQKEGAKAAKKKAIAEEVESVIENPDLTDKQRLFCLYQSRMFNASKAYQKAYGCDEYTARVNGSRLLTIANIREEIDRLKASKMNKAMLKSEDVFQKYMDIAFADITDYVDFGNEDMEVTTKSGDTKEITVSYVNIRNSDQVDGTLLSEVSQGREGIKVKLPDRMKALDWLAAHMDLATEEQKARVEYVRAQIDHIKADDGNTGESVVIVDDIPDESKSD